MEQALEQFIHSLYLRYATQLYHRAYRVLGDEGLSEDALHETFALAVSKANTLRGHPNPGGWLHVTLGHIMDKCLRKIYISELLSGDEVELLADTEKGNDLAHILPHQLREKERQILILRYQHKYTYQEIADMLGISLSACGMRLKRAEKRCRELMVNEKNF